MATDVSKQKQRSNPLLRIGKGVGVLLAALLGAAGGWIGWSALMVNHALPLEPALDAERATFRSQRAGMLSYYVDRRAVGRPLVLIHSINAGASAYEMRPIFEYYRGERPVYALDLPGFGFSERSDREYSPELYAAAIEDFLASEVGAPADLIALSLGGELSARAALSAPERFHSLTLISPTGFNERTTDNQVQSAGRSGTSDRLLRIFSFPLWSQAFYDLLVTPPSLRYFLQQNFVGPVDQGLLEYAYPTTHQPGARYAPLYFVSGKLFTSDAWERIYKDLDLPVLVIYDRDPNVSFELLPQALEQPNWHSARITPTLGLAHFEQLPQVAQALDRFWEQAQTERSSSRPVGASR
jgi:pimeloyl-ACP methyl ester carboxylesterase